MKLRRILVLAGIVYISVLNKIIVLRELGKRGQ